MIFGIKLTLKPRVTNKVLPASGSPSQMYAET